MNTSKESIFTDAILRWFSINKRSFPWRETRDPYKVLIAEILLQRTKAEQVEPVYNLFVEKYPTIKQLKGAKLTAIEKTIASLGLKKRARMIKTLSTEISAKYGNRIPDNEKDLLELTGVGYYVANAVCCHAYGMDLAAVDWNVARVIQRVWGVTVKSAPHADKKLIAFVRNLIPEGKGREFNLGIQDFATAICKANKPIHESCPIRDICEYYKRA